MGIRPLVHPIQQLRKLHPEGAGQVNQCSQAGLGFAVFDAGEVCPRDAGHSGENLLRDPAAGAQIPDLSPQASAHVHGHGLRMD